MPEYINGENSIEAKEYPPKAVEGLPDRPYPGEVYSPSQLFSYVWSRIGLSDQQEKALSIILSSKDNVDFRMNFGEVIKIEEKGDKTQALILLEKLVSQLNDIGIQG